MIAQPLGHVGWWEMGLLEEPYYNRRLLIVRFYVKPSGDGHAFQDRANFENPNQSEPPAEEHRRSSRPRTAR